MANAPVEIKKTAPAPTDYWQNMRREFDEMFDRFGMRGGFPAFPMLFDRDPAWRLGSSLKMPTPAVDVSEDDKAYKITAELPGLNVDDVTVSISGDMLTLRGEKRQEHEEKQANQHISERLFGSFERSFSLPPNVDRAAINAAFNNGILTLTLPKSAAAQSQVRKIEVKAA
ncbi:MAG TPA: Hsp20/alpha crystallin family protein [Dongiaceae bacterium]|nr:Hsp20/alpha crystallin family protein [Dongiaceae bacterium]